MNGWICAPTSDCDLQSGANAMRVVVWICTVVSDSDIASSTQERSEKGEERKKRETEIEE